GPDAAVEAGDMSPAVLPLRDLSLECRIADRMVLDLDRHPLDARVVARALRYCPALQRIADLEPEVVVPPARMMQLDHEDRPTPSAGPARLGLSGPGEVPLAAVVRPRHRAARLRRPACGARPSSHRPSTSSSGTTSRTSWPCPPTTWSGKPASSPPPSRGCACASRGSAGAATCHRPRRPRPPPRGARARRVPWSRPRTSSACG